FWSVSLSGQGFRTPGRRLLGEEIVRGPPSASGDGGVICPGCPRRGRIEVKTSSDETTPHHFQSLRCYPHLIGRQVDGSIATHAVGAAGFVPRRDGGSAWGSERNPVLWLTAFSRLPAHPVFPASPLLADSSTPDPPAPSPCR